MYRESLYQPFEIAVKQLAVCPKSAHKHNFFEVVYILLGTGKQCINNNLFDYHPGHLFLITPEDCHSFDIHETSQLVFIRFNNIYVRSRQQPGKSSNDWVRKMEYILYNATHQPGCILCHAPDKVFVKALMESLLSEMNGQQLYHTEVTAQLVQTLITVVARNIAMTLPDRISDTTENRVMRIINYIQEKIYQSDLLRLDVLSDHLGISVGYLSRYFKKHTGESLQQYIINYKLKLVETRLRHSDMRINEIVNELSFTDESHLNRLFKKYKGLNPSAYRKQQMNTVALGC